VVRDTLLGAPLATVRTPNGRAARSVACSDDDRWLLIGDYTGQLILREAPFADKSWEVSAHRSMVDKVAISRDASLVASAGDHLIRLCDRATGTLRQVFRGHHAKVSALTFSPDGQSLLSGDTKGVVKRWDITPEKEASRISGAAVSHSGDGAALCWKVNAGQTGFQRWDGEPLTLNIAAQGKECYVFHGGIILQATGAAGKENVLTIHEPGRDPVPWTLAGKLLACSPDGRWFSYTDAATGLTMLTDRSGVQPPISMGRGRHLSAPAFSADSRRCAMGDQGGWVRVYETATGKEILTIAAHTGLARGKALSANGTVLATAGFDGIAKLWDVASGQLRREFKGGTDTLWSVALSPDGRRLAAGTGESTVILWDTATGLETGTILIQARPYPIEFLVFTPDGTALIARGNVLRGSPD
jgi:WD40 repeat protein